MSTLRINNIEAKSVPASPTIDEKIKLTNSSGDVLVHVDGKTSGITTIGINTTAGNITFDANSNVVVTGIITATRFSGEITPTSLEIGSNIKLGNAGVITATSFVGSGANLTGITGTTINNNADNRLITGSGTANTLEGEANLTYDGTTLNIIDSASGSGSHRLTIGNSHDLRLYHDGNSTIGHYGDGDFYLTAENGKDLYLRAADDIFIKPQGGENGIIVTGNGAVELYHDGSKKFETNSTGTTLFCTGNGNNEGPKIEASSSMPAILNFQADAGAANNDKCRFYGHQGGGQLLLQDFSAGSFQNMANFKFGGAVELYHNGTKKFETTSGGSKVSGDLDVVGHVFPNANNTYDLGTNGNRWRNVYTTDLQLSNEGKSNDVDGTWGNYTIQEGESDLFLINNRSGKKYKFNLTEVS